MSRFIIFDKISAHQKMCGSWKIGQIKICTRKNKSGKRPVGRARLLLVIVIMIIM